MDPDPSARDAGARGLYSRFPALSNHDYRLLWLGQIISVSGSQMQSVAINWQLYQETGSAVTLGLVGLCRVIPILLFSLIGGVVADSYSRRRIMFMSQSLGMTSALVLGITSMLGLASPVVILAMTAVTAAAAAFDNPARQALVPNLVPPEHLTNAVSLNTMMFQTSMILGPAIAGLVIDAVGVEAVYWINAVSYLAVIIALALMKVVERPGLGRSNVNIGSMLEGLKFVKSNTLIFSTMLLDFFATFFASATALLPIYAKDILKVGAKGLGLLYSAEAIGSLIAGFGMSILGDPKRKGRLLLASVALYGLATILFGLSDQYIFSLFLLGLVGAGDSVSTVLRSTIRQTVTPDHIRGRMTSVNMIFFMGGPQLGNLEAGLVAAALGAPLAVVTGGIATVVVVGVTAWFFPQLRRYGEEDRSLVENERE